MSPIGCGCGGSAKSTKEYVVVTPHNGEFVVHDRNEAINLVRQHGGTWTERPATPR